MGGKKTWKMLDLFSGIGGFSLAASWVWKENLEIISFCECDPFCQKVLKKHWPKVPIISDIRDVTHERIMAYTSSIRERFCRQGGNLYNQDGNSKTKEQKRNDQQFRFESLCGFGATTIQTATDSTINLLTGGFPCQPFSVAGKQRSEKDDRYLWPEMLRVIQEIRPTWIIGENVAGIINLALDQVLSDLENEGYACQPFIIPACAKDAPHRRDRVWIVANSNSEGLQRFGGKHGFISEQKTRHSIGDSCQENGTREDWLPEPAICRVAHGIPQRVDRLKSLGNAICPSVVVPIMEAIKETSWINT